MGGEVKMMGMMGGRDGGKGGEMRGGMGRRRVRGAGREVEEEGRGERRAELVEMRGKVKRMIEVEKWRGGGRIREEWRCRIKRMKKKRKDEEEGRKARKREGRGGK